MDSFEYGMVLVSIVIALAIAHLLNALAACFHGSSSHWHNFWASVDSAWSGYRCIRLRVALSVSGTGGTWFVVVPFEKF